MYKNVLPLRQLLKERVTTCTDRLHNSVPLVPFLKLRWKVCILWLCNTGKAFSRVFNALAVNFAVNIGRTASRLVSEKVLEGCRRNLDVSTQKAV